MNSQSIVVSGENLEKRQGSYAIDYPILAYKSISPDNKEIVLMHLACKVPQRSIHLGDWEFLSFVDGKHKFDDNRSQIFLLVKNRIMKQTKVLAIFVDPWKAIDFKEPFDMPEHIFMIKDCEVHLPKFHSISYLSAGTRIKRIYFKLKVDDDYQDKMLYTMVV